MEKRPNLFVGYEGKGILDVASGGAVTMTAVTRAPAITRAGQR